MLLSEVCAAMSPEELEISLSAAAAALCVNALLETASAAPQLLQVDVGADVIGRCVSISIPIPVTACAGSSMCMSSLTLSGYSMAEALRVEIVEV